VEELERRVNEFSSLFSTTSSSSSFSLSSTTTHPSDSNLQQQPPSSSSSSSQQLIMRQLRSLESENIKFVIFTFYWLVNIKIGSN